MAPEFGKVVLESGEMRPKPLTPCYGSALARPEFRIWRYSSQIRLSN